MPSGFYLICDLGVPENGLLPSNKLFSQISNPPRTDILTRAIYLTDVKRITKSKKFNYRDGRYIFWFKNNLRNDEKAQWIVDALIATLEFIYQFSVTRVDYTPTAFWLPQSSLYQKIIFKKQKFAKSNPTLVFRLGYSAILPKYIIDKAWEILHVTLNQPFFDAIHFYQASIREFCFLGDSIGTVLNDPIAQPVSRLDLVRAENAVLNAFKAIEAIIGDPPKNDAKLRKKLIQVGVDPDALAGFSQYEELKSMSEKIRQYSYLRDKKAAHGRSRVNRRITYFEIMDIQTFAQAFIQNAIDKVRTDHSY